MLRRSWAAVHRDAVSSLTQLWYPHSHSHYLAQIDGFWLLMDSKWWHCVMVDAGSHLKLLSVDIGQIQSVWTHWYAVHGHTPGAAFHSYTYPTWLIFWGTWWLAVLETSFVGLITRWVLLMTMSSTDGTASRVYWPPPAIMDSVLATIVASGWACCQ